ncbi:hypothetical protein [Clostridium peptidivorans]|uniref:hypothetical protein n=1 Tax=Clostridium peptidivorans TaxID=100174 RepID=UPI000BE326D2|nr:hypothetical protein [Clostridium peptidivorans]
MKNKKLIIVIVIFALLLIIGNLFNVYSLLKNFNKDSSKKVLHISITSINNTNNKTSNLIKKQSIDIEKSRKELPIIIKELKEVKDNLNNIETNNPNHTEYGNLLQGLNYNIHIYEQLAAIFANPQGGDMDKALITLKNFNNKCLYHYSLFHTNRLSISLTDKSKTYINNCTSYIDDLIRIRKTNEINAAQYKEFINSMDEILSSFVNVKMNYNDYVDRLNKNLSLDSLMEIVDSNVEEVQEIKTEFSKLTVPSNSVYIYELFLTTLNNYISYIQNFKLDVISYQNQKETSNHTKEVTSTYNETEVSYSTLNNNFNSFVDSYEKFKEDTMN